MKQRKTKFGSIFVLTFFSAIIPFAVYYIAKATDKLKVSSKLHELDRFDVMHGPWNGSLPHEIAIAVPMLMLLVLAVLTIIYGILASIKKLSKKPLITSIVLAAIQLGIFYLQYITVYWTID